MTTIAAWRPMTPDDMDDVERIAEVAHPGFPEAGEVLAEKLALHPAGCFILEATDGSAIGYLLSHPWRSTDAPALDTLIGELPEPEVYYIHDIALLPASRGMRAGEAAVRQVETHARELGIDRIALVAVNKSTGFWQRQGFQSSTDPKWAAKLASYGSDAVYMTRILAENPA